MVAISDVLLYIKPAVQRVNLGDSHLRYFTQVGHILSIT